jgi:hypothetical protein
MPGGAASGHVKSGRAAPDLRRRRMSCAAVASVGVAGLVTTGKMR